MIERKTASTVHAPNGEVLSASITEEPGAESSVEISENSKGFAQVSVKVYHADPKVASDQAVEIYLRTVEKLRRKL